MVDGKHFLGLTHEEAAEALRMKLRSMQRIGRDVRHRLFERADSQWNPKHKTMT